MYQRLSSYQKSRQPFIILDKSALAEATELWNSPIRPTRIDPLNCENDLLPHTTLWDGSRADGPSNTYSARRTIGPLSRHGRAFGSIPTRPMGMGASG